MLFIFEKRIAKKYLWLFLAATFFSLTGLSVSAQNTRQYHYDEILTNIHINQDTTFDVEERQIFNYQGEYNQGWRSIPFNKFDAITDIEVIDGETGMPLIYSKKELDKTDPNSWGKYTFNRKNGAENIIWYYNLKDTTHLWILKYKIHGGLGFFKQYDELYWNVMTDFTVPVKKAETHVFLPKNLPSSDGMHINYYVSPSPISANSSSYSISEDMTFDYYSGDLVSKSKVTILAQWPKNIVDQKQYWRDFLKIYWGYIVSLFLILAGVICGFLYWYFTEKYNKGKGTVIAQYSPPKNLRPAVAEIICKEKVTTKTWPATVVDLAVRGYVKINEKSPSRTQKIFSAFIIFIIFFLPIVIIAFLAGIWGNSGGLFQGFNAFFVILFIMLFTLNLVRIRKLFSGYTKAYDIEKIKEFSIDQSLEGYEKKFLEAIFKNGNTFSTDETDQKNKQALFQEMQSVKKELLQNTEADTQAYEVSLAGEIKRNTILYVAFFVYSIFLFVFFSQITNAQNMVLGTTVIAIILEFIYFKYEARLNDRGNILKEDWLGFKLYLETAEKYRMQNLTPDLFEKYLPYAIIFGVEKQWSRQFDSLNMRPPDWYSGSSVVGSSGFSGSSPSFSASSFASSFSASFASSFANSGAGGAGGGGGGAGGGGGGGGGGAS